MIRSSCWIDCRRRRRRDGRRAGSSRARIDFTRLGAFGHSMGGVMAGQFCVEDRRCRAGLNLDGIPQYGTMIDATMSRPFMMVYSARPGRAGASDAIYRRVRPPVLPRRRAGHPAPRLHRHGVLGRTAARAAGDRPDCPGANRRHHPRRWSGSSSTRNSWAGARRCCPGRRGFRKSRSGHSRRRHGDGRATPRIIALVSPAEPSWLPVRWARLNQRN